MPPLQSVSPEGTPAFLSAIQGIAPDSPVSPTDTVEDTFNRLLSQIIVHSDTDTPRH